jgi:glutathione S-transferase
MSTPFTKDHMMAADIILHQYDTSPFSEKVRVMLGVKGVAWRSCLQPVIMPKPELTALTGGYRKIPVMQIGADIYCDSRLIIHELDRLFPSPSPLGAGLGDAISVWSDKSLFPLSVPMIFGAGTFPVDDAFKKDREAMSGQPFNPAAMAAYAPFASAQMKAHLANIDAQLADGRAFLAGEAPSLADAAVYYILAFLRAAYPAGPPVIAAMERLRAWEQRVRAIGHGARTEISRADALEIARAAEPAPPPASLDDDPLGLRLGQSVGVSADDYGREQIVGELIALGIDHIALRRRDPLVGDVAVHFPRIGFAIRAL